jgi:hypothetical protein
MSQDVSELRLEDLAQVKPHLITKLNRAGIESVIQIHFVE